MKSRVLQFLVVFPLLTVLLFLTSPDIALAFNLENAAMSLLGFLKLLIVVGAAAIAIVMVMRSQIIPAMVVVVSAAFLYVILDPTIMEAIGNAIRTLIKL